MKGLPAGARRIVIDGISGSGKTTLANSLRSGFIVLHLDDWYPGWDGLAEGTRVAEELLTGQRFDYPRWNWAAGQATELVPVAPSQPWIIEGCGALTPVTAAVADFSIWVETPVPIARDRALARDGNTYLPWWDMWHQQELEHWKAHDPRSLADVVIKT